MRIGWFLAKFWASEGPDYAVCEMQLFLLCLIMFQCDHICGPFSCSCVQFCSSHGLSWVIKVWSSQNYARTCFWLEQNLIYGNFGDDASASIAFEIHWCDKKWNGLLSALSIYAKMPHKWPHVNEPRFVFHFSENNVWKFLFLTIFLRKFGKINPYSQETPTSFQFKNLALAQKTAQN